MMAILDVLKAVLSNAAVLVGLIALSACVAPIATSPTVDTPSGPLQLIEFYSPL